MSMPGFRHESARGPSQGAAAPARRRKGRGGWEEEARVERSSICQPKPLAEATLGETCRQTGGTWEIPTFWKVSVSEMPCRQSQISGVMSRTSILQGSNLAHVVCVMQTLVQQDDVRTFFICA
eukprot:3724526-Rhodomonas_salina.1